MKTKFFLCAFFALFGFMILEASAQQSSDSMYFDYRIDNVVINSPDLMYGAHPFGDNIARKFAVIQNTYTYVVPGEPSSPGHKTTIVKPTLYNAVRKINSYYRKVVKDKQMDQAEAAKLLNHVFDVAISVFTQPTAALEAELKKYKKPEDLAAVFKRVKIK